MNPAEVKTGRLPRFDLPAQIPVPGDRKTIPRNPFEIAPLPNPFIVPLLDPQLIHPKSIPPRHIPVPNTKRQPSGSKLNIPYVLVPDFRQVTNSQPPVAKSNEGQSPEAKSIPPRRPRFVVKRVAGSRNPGRLPAAGNPSDANDMDVDPPNDGSSDIEGELQVADTPTTSQEALVEADSSNDEGDDAEGDDELMDTRSESDVLIMEGRYFPQTIPTPDRADIPVISPLPNPAGNDKMSTEADRKGKKKAQEWGNIGEDPQGRGAKMVQPGPTSAKVAATAATAGTAGNASNTGTSSIPGTSGSGHGHDMLIAHPADLMGEIAELLDHGEITNENIQTNFQQLVCFLFIIISIPY